MNYEWSEISQSGDVELSREFQYWKPRIDFKWDYRKNRQVRFSILRNVGQINFDDFISSFDQFEERKFVLPLCTLQNNKSYVLSGDIRLETKVYK
mgnify:CR=1 FL=1